MNLKRNKLSIGVQGKVNPPHSTGSCNAFLIILIDSIRAVIRMKNGIDSRSLGETDHLSLILTDSLDLDYSMNVQENEVNHFSGSIFVPKYFVILDE